jgi:hypothetical protein
MLTRIRSSNIKDEQVKTVDLADLAVTTAKLSAAPTAQPGFVLSVDINGDLVFTSQSATATAIGDLVDVDTTTVPPVNGDRLTFNSMLNLWVPAADTAVSASRTFVVDDIAARDALSPAEGDQAFVREAADGEYALYLWDAAWIKISTKDSARSDARTLEALVIFSTSGPILLGNVSEGSRVTLVTIEVEPDDPLDPLSGPFNGGPSLTVGDSGNPARLMANDFHDLSEAGTYNLQSDYVYTGILDTDLFVYFDAGGATKGQARILVTYV